jgi:phosphate regulon transcriptional regulator PhoB
MTKILIIEDEKDIVEALEYNLKREGFETSKSYDGYNGLRIAKEKSPDLILLDLMLPGVSGLEICKQLKRYPRSSEIPIIMLTAKSEETDKVLGLELGADDYITKPFSMRELLARIKTVLKRSGGTPAESVKPQIKISELEIDEDKHLVKVAGKSVELTAKEFALLLYLARNKERVFSREKLLDAIWQVEADIETRTVDVHIRRLREKLGKAGRHIHTLRGVGYKFLP